MPEDLLLELEATSRVSGNLEAMENLVRAAMECEKYVALAVDDMKGSAPLFDEAWRQLVMDVARGQTALVHSLRSRLLGALEKRLRALKHTHALATSLRELGSTRISDPAYLLAEISDMERLKRDVFDRWQTADDLEDLAARDYPLTTADLDQIGPQRRPVPSYYAEDSKPF